MNTDNYFINNISDYELIYPKLNIREKQRKIILMKGELGSGKTTFIKEFLAHRFDFYETTSPTFAIINKYEIFNNNTYHYDLYRINKSHELDDIGMYENLEIEALHFIEWPEIIPDNLINPDIIISFQIHKHQRLISLEHLNE